MVITFQFMCDIGAKQLFSFLSFCFLLPILMCKCLGQIKYNKYIQCVPLFFKYLKKGQKCGTEALPLAAEAVSLLTHPETYNTQIL